MPAVPLADDLVQLVPLVPAHAAALDAAAADGDLGRLWYTSTPEPGGAAASIDAALNGAGSERMEPYAVIDRRRDEVVGTTRYSDLEPTVPRLAIGYTWYARSAQRTHVNRASTRLLLAHAFEVRGCATVEFHTDFRNQPSRQALERLGARQDGILRAHQRRPDGTLRDLVCFSIVAAEWPDVRRTLDLRIERSLAASPPPA